MTTPTNPSSLKDWIAALTEFHAHGKPLKGDAMLVLRDVLATADASLSKVENAVNTIVETKRAHRDLADKVRLHLNDPDNFTREELVKLVEAKA